MPIFAAKKRRKGLDMIYLAMIFAGCIIGLFVGLMNPDKSGTKKSHRRKKKNFFVRLGEDSERELGYPI